LAQCQIDGVHNPEEDQTRLRRSHASFCVRACVRACVSAKTLIV
jgi:hypothetical protein